MASNLDLPLQVQPVDTATPLNNYVTNVQGDRTRVLQQQELQAQIAQTQFQHMSEVSQANIKGMIVSSALIKPYLDSGNVEGAQAILGRVAKDPIMGKNASLMSQMIQSGNVKDLQGHVDGMMNAGKVLGFIQPDIKSVSPGETLFDVNTGKPVISAPIWGGLDQGATPSANPPPLPATGGAGQGAQAAPAQPSTAATPQNPASEGAALNETYLATLPPQVQAVVKGMVNGDIQPPNMVGKNAGLAMQLDAAARTYDPTYSQLDWTTRKAMRVNAATGTLGKSNIAVNTLAQHLIALKQAGAALGNGRFPMINSAENYLAGQAGQSNITNFLAIKDAVGNELAKALVGGATAESDRKEAMDRFNAAQSPDQLNGAIQSIGKLLAGKVQANKDQYAQSMMGAGRGYNPVSPNAAAAYKSLGIDINTDPNAPTALPAQSPEGDGWLKTSSGIPYKVIQ